MSESLQSLKDQVTDLEAALESARTEQAALVEKLQAQELLEQEVENLRQALKAANSTISEQTETDALSSEVEKLTAALVVSEEKCEQLQATLSNTPDLTGADTSLSPQDAPPIKEVMNRDLFASHLEKLLPKKDASAKQAVLYILLDNFVRIRNEIGIMNSEHVMHEILEIIKSQCGSDDIVSRFGDCTIALLTSDVSPDKTQEMAENIRSLIEKHIFECSDHSVITTASIGICSIRKSDTSAKDIVSRADLACEAARVSGGNQVLISSAIVDEIVTIDCDRSIEEMVRKTISQNRIKIYYQPISSLNAHQSSHYEVLTRVYDESGNTVLPGEFFSMAEASGQSVEVDLYVIESIMRMLSDNADPELELFMKLTKKSVADQELAAWISGKIEEHGIDPQQLVFEVSESILQSDLKNLSLLSKALNTMGCKMAIEHYQMVTQPQHLQHVHADYIKIDSSLIENISSDSESLSLVGRITDVAKTKNCITIAEGVESPACLAILWELGVKLAQGYFIQEPTGKRDYEFQCDVTVDDRQESKKAVFKVG